jgi:hypothetical protein
MGAWIVLVLGLPCYLLVLRVRIRQEEAVMQQHFPQYATRPVRLLPTSPRESRFSLAYSHPCESNPMMWRSI